MKVLAVHNTARVGGGEVSLNLSLELARSAGVEVLAAVPDRGRLTGTLDGIGIPYRVLAQPTLKSPSGLRSLWSPDPAWDAVVSKFQPDLIHANGIRAAVYAQAAGRARGIPVVFHARIADPDPLMDPFILDRVNAVFYVTRAVGERFPPGRGTASRYLLYNAVDLDRFETPHPGAGELRSRWGGDRDLVVGVVGELSPVKGPDRLLEAAPEILRRCPNARFVFVGEPGPDPEFVRRLGERARATPGLGERTVFAGFVDDMRAVYAAMDLVVVGSRSEGFGRVVVEAGAAGRPVVASDLPAIRELIAPESRDWIVDFDDRDSVAGAIVRILTDPERTGAVVAAQKAHVGLHFGGDTHRDRLVELWARVRAEASGT